MLLVCYLYNMKVKLNLLKYLLNYQFKNQFKRSKYLFL